MKSNWKVYKHTAPSGNVYIGITQQPLYKRWQRGGGYKLCKAFYRAILKYGWDNIEHKVLFDNLSELDAKLIEQDLIHYYKKIGKSYNITDGGDGTLGIKRDNVSDDTRLKLSKSITKARGRKVVQLTKDGALVNEWDSLSAAARAIGADRSSMVHYCKGRYNHRLFVFKYKEDYYEEDGD